MQIYRIDGLEMLLIMSKSMFFKTEYFFKYHSSLRSINIWNVQYEFREYVYKKKHHQPAIAWIDF